MRPDKASMKHRLLVIEDSADLAELLPLHLQELGCDVVIARDGRTGLQLLGTGSFDLVILDLILPDVAGVSICRKMRETRDFTPIVMLTSRASETDRVLGLEAGADDYITKPFSIAELQARVRAILRRRDIYGSVPGVGSEALELGSLQIDLRQRRVSVRQKDAHLTAKEFDLLLYFARSPGRVFTRAQLLDAVWGYGHDGYEHTVNSHINRLRAKIERDPRNPEFIVTIWGVGYRLDFGPQHVPPHH